MEISNCLDGTEEHYIRDCIPEIDADCEDADPFTDLSEDDPDELENFEEVPVDKKMKITFCSQGTFRFVSLLVIT